MFKRILVLVIFLFGVFWWLTHRNDPVEETLVDVPSEVSEQTEVSANTEDPKTETEEETKDTANTKVDSQGETSEKSDNIDEVEENENVEKTPKNTKQESKTEKKEAKKQVPQKLIKPTPYQKALLAEPIVLTSLKAPPAKIQTPNIPNRETEIRVYMYEWGVDFSDKTIPAGTIHFEVKNSGRFTHEFSIRGIGTLGEVTPNSQKTFTVKLAVGDYEVFSERRKDYERGVKETFSVVE